MEQRDRVLNAAKERFVRFGFKKTTMDEISGDARISKKTLYELFRDKEDLFVSLFIREALAAREYLFSNIEGLEDPREKLLRLSAIIGDYFNQEHFMVRVLRDDGALYTPYLKQSFLEQIEEETIRIISGILEEGIRKKRFRRMDTGIAGYAIFKLFQSFTYARTSYLQDDAASRRSQMRELMDFMLKGLATK
ncbi:MAG: TetR/AcrR family transcriptional regulator [Spirochaetes bacterium]|nr:TetR/AcrR family transcriptional regulator [Spirochaetota bacterium]